MTTAMIAPAIAGSGIELKKDEEEEAPVLVELSTDISVN